MLRTCNKNYTKHLFLSMVVLPPIFVSGLVLTRLCESSLLSIDAIAQDHACIILLIHAHTCLVPAHRRFNQFEIAHHNMDRFQTLSFVSGQ